MIESYVQLAAVAVAKCLQLDETAKREFDPDSRTVQIDTDQEIVVARQIRPDETLISVIREDVRSIVVRWERDGWNERLPTEGPSDGTVARLRTLLAPAQRSFRPPSPRAGAQDRTERPPEGAAPPSVRADPATAPDRRIGDMPDFEDEYEMQHHRRAVGLPPDVPTIGDRDLHPPGLPRHPTMSPFVDPLADPGHDGGMYPSMNHPLFGRPSYDNPPPGVPPGARYDDPTGDSPFPSLPRPRPGFGPGSGSGSGGPPGFPPGPFF
ncbi:Piso0_003488 [Millerozyma farinosa CBS 7064]|uniref:Piso0_003488 protein n=1 Tax=Pichia sorbitophila (strain ATCC MYA-4447 / BCRC 22081 / CBS 7064 / NBRC 10061 / NRRL Y-12695) TaxID=559304 RepID=G8YJ77_PICSO|nr:Piso0_003488 [Millerozyma farinosa CBS 7064]CCE81137.1 Piso0_003488 [Millerozyma farinosa CBS 7064]